MAYTAMNFDYLLGLEGMSDGLLKNHFTLYNGYVNNTNKAADLLLAMANEQKTATPEYAELKRRFGWEFNGMRLHELYFSNMKRGGSKIGPKMAAKLDSNFGSYEKWEADFKATGAMRGIGWVVLYSDSDRLLNCWINEHDCGHLSGAKPLLVMDVFEHAYMLDYGLKRADYINAFMKAIDWGVVEKRM